jgi:hypothetical protein
VFVERHSAAHDRRRGGRAGLALRIAQLNGKAHTTKLHRLGHARRRAIAVSGPDGVTPINAGHQQPITANDTLMNAETALRRIVTALRLRVWQYSR